MCVCLSTFCCVDWTAAGNEIGAMLAHWSWVKYKAGGGNPADAVMIASTVSSKMIAAMAAKEGFAFQETLTGFKWMVRGAPHWHTGAADASRSVFLLVLLRLSLFRGVRACRATPWRPTRRPAARCCLLSRRPSASLAVRAHVCQCCRSPCLQGGYPQLPWQCLNPLFLRCCLLLQVPSSATRTACPARQCSRRWPTTTRGRAGRSWSICSTSTRRTATS